MPTKTNNTMYCCLKLKALGVGALPWINRALHGSSTLYACINCELGADLILLEKKTDLRYLVVFVMTFCSHRSLGYFVA